MTQLQQQMQACPVVYCDKCHIRLGNHETRVIWRDKKYHKPCYEIVRDEINARLAR